MFTSNDSKVAQGVMTRRMDRQTEGLCLQKRSFILQKSVLKRNILLVVEPGRHRNNGVRQRIGEDIAGETAKIRVIQVAKARKLLDYYRLHLEHLPEIHSHQILQEVLGGIARGLFSQLAIIENLKRVD